MSSGGLGQSSCKESLGADLHLTRGLGWAQGFGAPSERFAELCRYGHADRPATILKGSE